MFAAPPTAKIQEGYAPSADQSYKVTHAVAAQQEARLQQAVQDAAKAVLASVSGTLLEHAVAVGDVTKAIAAIQGLHDVESIRAILVSAYMQCMIKTAQALAPGLEKQIRKAHPAVKFSEAVRSHAAGYVYAALPAKAAQALLDFGASIDPAHLFPDGLELSPHVTLKYGILPDDPDLIRAVLRGEYATMRLGLTTLFRSETRDVLICSVQSETLPRLHAKLSAIPNVDEYALGYTPHATIAYLRPGYGSLYANRRLYPPELLHIRDVYFADADRVHYVIPLDGTPPAFRFAEDVAGDKVALFGSSFSLINPHSQSWIDKSAADLVTVVSSDVRANIKEIMASAYRQEITVPQTIDTIKQSIGLNQPQAKALAKYTSMLQSAGVAPNKIKELSGQMASRQLKYRAQMIARTETIAASNKGQQALWTASADAGFLDRERVRQVWILTVNACDQCEEEAQNFPELGGTFSGVLGPPAHPNCFLPESTVEGPRYEALAVRHYDGPVVRVITRLGYSLSVTPNHPILTSKGWVTAGLLKEGDKLFSRNVDDKRVVPVDEQDYQVPALIEDVLKAFGESPSVSACPVPTTLEDFHYDGSHSDIAVIYTHGLLSNGFKPEVSELLKDKALRSVELASLLDPQSATSQVFNGALRSSDSGMSRPSVPGILSGTPLSHHQAVSLSLPAALHSGIQERTLDGSPTDAEALTQRILAIPGYIQADDVVSVEFDTYQGLVYNLQTQEGYYIVNGIATSNCRCAVGLDWAPPSEESSSKLEKAINGQPEEEFDTGDANPADADGEPAELTTEYLAVGGFYEYGDFGTVQIAKIDKDGTVHIVTEHGSEMITKAKFLKDVPAEDLEKLQAGKATPIPDEYEKFKKGDDFTNAHGDKGTVVKVDADGVKIQYITGDVINYTVDGIDQLGDVTPVVKGAKAPVFKVGDVVVSTDGIEGTINEVGSDGTVYVTANGAGGYSKPGSTYSFEPNEITNGQLSHKPLEGTGLTTDSGDEIKIGGHYLLDKSMLSTLDKGKPTHMTVDVEVIGHNPETGKLKVKMSGGLLSGGPVESEVSELSAHNFVPMPDAAAPPAAPIVLPKPPEGEFPRVDKHDPDILPAYKKWSDGLTADQMAAIGDYTSTGHRNLNEQLRNGDSLKDYTKSLAKDLDAALAKGSTPRDMTVFRSAGRTAYTQVKDLPLGAVFDDLGYGSSSIDRDLGFGGVDGRLQMTIQIPQGAPGAYVDHISSNGGSEKEFLIPRGARYQILSTDFSGVTPQMTVRML